jgi:hypothetical protein
MFPDIPVSHWVRRPQRLQKRIATLYGDPQINEPHPFLIQNMEWNSEWLLPAEIDLVEAWFADNSTTFFSIYDNHGWASRAIPLTIFATIVGGQMAYTLPVKELAGLFVFDVTANAVVAPARFTVAAGAGAEGEDVLTFIAGQLPPAGHVLSYSATGGRRKWTVWCITEELPQRAYGEGDLFTLDSPLQFTTRRVP